MNSYEMEIEIEHLKTWYKDSSEACQVFKEFSFYMTPIVLDYLPQMAKMDKNLDVVSILKKIVDVETFAADYEGELTYLTEWDNAIISRMDKIVDAGISPLEFAKILLDRKTQDMFAECSISEHIDEFIAAGIDLKKLYKVLVKKNALHAIFDCADKFIAAGVDIDIVEFLARALEDPYHRIEETYFEEDFYNPQRLVAACPNKRFYNKIIKGFKNTSKKISDEFMKTNMSVCEISKKYANEFREQFYDLLKKN